MHVTFYVLATRRSGTAITFEIKLKLSKTRVRPTSCEVMWRPKYFCYTEYYTLYSKLYQVEPKYVEVILCRVLVLFWVSYTKFNICAIQSMLNCFFFIRILFIRITRFKIAKKLGISSEWRSGSRSLILIRIYYFSVQRWLYTVISFKVSCDWVYFLLKLLLYSEDVSTAISLKIICVFCVSNFCPLFYI